MHKLFGAPFAFVCEFHAHTMGFSLVRASTSRCRSS
jgi:hypothetical protein